MKFNQKEVTRSALLLLENAGLLCFIIYSMLIANYHARILSLGEVTEKNNFKKCIALIETKERKGEDGDVIYSPEKFEVEVAISNDKTYDELLTLAGHSGNLAKTEPAYFPATLNLRSFTYKEKDKDKLGKQLQLKRWTR